MREDHAAVLPTHVGTLPVHLRRIVQVPEHVDQRFVGNSLRIEADLHDFGMFRRAPANLLVRRLCHGATHVAYSGPRHARQARQNLLDAPEAAGAEAGKLCGDRRAD